MSGCNWAPETQDRLGRILGGETVPRRRTQSTSAARTSACGAGLDRLHRRYENAAGWLLGGGSKKRALTAVRDAAHIESDFFSYAEAEFALWDMLVRERDMTHAAEVARRLAHDFPDNPQLATFLEVHDATACR
jgi:hypothetical protein